jgi:hypothetical protein
MTFCLDPAEIIIQRQDECGVYASSGMKMASTTFGNTMLSQKKLNKPSRVVTFSVEGAGEHIIC